METRLDFLLVKQVVRIDGDGRKDLRRRRVVVRCQTASATSESGPERSRREEFVFASACRSALMLLSGVVKLFQMILEKITFYYYRHSI